MVTLIKYGTLGGGEKYNVNQMWIDGLSTDNAGSKPTTTINGMPIPNGSVYTEVDTGKNFMFDYDNATWYEVSIGGGGGTSGGIVLVGETTTQLVDNATTNPITVDGQSYTAQPNDAVIYGNKEFLFDGTKWHEFGDLSGLSSKDIGSMTNYVIAQTGAAINTSDTLNQAIGKVEKRVSDNETNILLNDNKISGISEQNTNKAPIDTIVKTNNNVDYNYVDGKITISGTANDSGGRNVKIIPFTLSAGTYYIKQFNVTGTIPTMYLQNGTSILAQPNASTYTSFYLSSAADVHIGFNTVSGTEYSGSCDVMISKEQPSSYTKPSLIAVDTVARSGLTALEPLRYSSTNPTIYRNNLHTLSGIAVGKYVNQNNGQLANNAEYTSSDYIPITSNTDYGAYNINHYAWYNSAKTYISGGQNPKYLTSPATAAYIRYSWSKYDCGNTNVVLSPKADYDKNIDIHNFDLSKRADLQLYPVNGKKILTADTMTASSKLETGMHNIKKNNIYAFTARITSFGEIKVGHGTNVYGSSYLTINDTKVTLTNYSNSASTTEFVHGLTITDFITVTIITSVDKFKFIITTNGGRYEQDNLTWAGNGRATSYVECVSGSLTNCEFTWTCKDFTKSISIFGDSYLTTDVSTRWAYYLTRDGFINNVLISNYPGEGSADALISFYTITALCKPLYAVWCMGMNDGSDTNEEPSETWLTNIQAFIVRCKLYGVTPILATIPSVPTIDHTYKNAWVRNSGYRYIDFEKAVGADISTSWYTDMLSSDGVHPDTLGAEALYNQVLLDFPEITFDS